MAMGRRKRAIEVAELARRRWTEAEARRVLRAHAQSGKSVLAFAQDHGLVAERVYRWRRKLGVVDENRPTNQAEEIEFAPVVVTGGRGRESAVTVRVGEVDIDVVDPTSVAPDWVARVVAELRGR